MLFLSDQNHPKKGSGVTIVEAIVVLAITTIVLLLLSRTVLNSLRFIRRYERQLTSLQIHRINRLLVSDLENCLEIVVDEELPDYIELKLPVLQFHLEKESQDPFFDFRKPYAEEKKEKEAESIFSEKESIFKEEKQIKDQDRFLFTKVAYFIDRQNNKLLRISRGKEGKLLTEEETKTFFDEERQINTIVQTREFDLTNIKVNLDIKGLKPAQDSFFTGPQGEAAQEDDPLAKKPYQVIHIDYILKNDKKVTVPVKNWNAKDNVKRKRTDRELLQNYVR
jgi:hypothetical protein